MKKARALPTYGCFYFISFVVTLPNGSGFFFGNNEIALSGMIASSKIIRTIESNLSEQYNGTAIVLSYEYLREGYIEEDAGR